MTPDSKNLYIGAGEVLFDRFDDDGKSTGYRHLGNVEDFGISTSVDKMEKKSSMDGPRSLLKEVITGSDHEISLILDEFEAHNLALALLGSVTTFTQGADTVNDGEINSGAALDFDKFYYLGKKKVSSVVITQGATELEAGTDYELNEELGLVKILSTGGGSEAITTWDGDCAAVNSDLVGGLAVGKVEGALKFFSAKDQAAGPRYEVDVHKINLAPDGELKLIGEEFGNFTLKGKAQKDATKPAGQQFLTMRELDPSTAEVAS